MSLRSYSDVPNRVVNFFLQEAGAEYDRNRGLVPYRRLTPQVRAYFGDACAYCGAAGELVEDHVVARNRVAVGLHSWGNVVPACVACNRLKRGTFEWLVHLEAVEPDPELRSNRAQRIRSFQSDYNYQPDIASLRVVLESLYRLSDAHTRSLVAFAITASQPYIQGMSKLQELGRVAAQRTIPDDEIGLDR